MWVYIGDNKTMKCSLNESDRKNCKCPRWCPRRRVFVIDDEGCESPECPFQYPSNELKEQFVGLFAHVNKEGGV